MKILPLPSKSRSLQIAKLALPIIAGMLSHNIISLVDTAMIGVLGDGSLAAVGLGGFLFYLMMAIPIGIGAGIQTKVARLLGEKRHSELTSPLTNGLVLMSIASILISLIFWELTPYIFRWLSEDPSVQDMGIPYFHWRTVGLFFIGVNFAFRGYWNGIKKPLTYLSILFVTHICNIFFNWMLIFGNLGAPKMGTTGAGIGTTLSLIIGSIIYVTHAYFVTKPTGLFSKLSFTKLRGLLKLSLPTSLEEFFHALGLMVLLGIIGLIGTAEVAISSVLINIALVALLPGIGFGMAALTLVSEALGAKNKNDAEKWGWDIVKLATGVVLMLGLVGFLFPEFVLGFFIRTPSTLIAAIPLLKLESLTVWIEVAGLVLIYALYGAGATQTVFKVAVTTRWVFAIPLCYIVGIVLDGGLFGIWVTLVIYHVINFVLFGSIWAKRDWGDQVI